jgi:hypothetical protein
MVLAGETEVLGENLKLQREGCSPQTLLHQVSSSQLRSEVAHSDNSSHKHPKFQWQDNPQESNRVSQLLHSLNNQVSQFRLKMQTVNLLTTHCE